MLRLFAIILLTGIVLTSVSTATDLQYLDPIKLQTISTPLVQAKQALNLISTYDKRVNVEINRQLFKDNKDSFILTVINDKLHITASTGVAALWGFNYYLKKYCKSQIEWQTSNVRIPYPLPFANETVVANDRFRYYQNVCTVSYSFVWWKTEQWKEHVKWMALNGINLALAPVAQEAAWTRVYRRIGMTQEEIDQYSAGPAFLSWLRMGNVHGWGGPLPKSWHDLQMNIQNEIIQFMINLGIVPVLPAFNGHVPIAFKRLFPNSTFHQATQWNNFKTEYCCDLFVDPNDHIFKLVGKMFLEELRAPQGIHLYTADPYNELSISEFSTAFVRDTAEAIFTTMTEFDNNAVWLIQNWMFVNSPDMWPKTRVQSFINAVPNGRMLILDLQSEQWPQYDRYEMYYGQPFIWCMLHNFGGTLGMFGNMVTINRDVYQVRSRVNSTMIGIGLTPEGIYQNYVVYDLMLESAWRKSPVQDLDAWTAEYAERRYGCNETAEAWRYLLKSVYSFNGVSRLMGQYVVTDRPSFKIKPWAWYKSYDLFHAFRKLIFVNDTNCKTEGYRYDVVDVARQALQYRTAQLYRNLVSDRYSNTFVFENSIRRFLSVLEDMSLLLSRSPYFLASNWFMQAWNLGTNYDEASLYVFNSKNQITLWGPDGEISDYACKQWAEMVGNYYLPRWQTFLSAALRSKIAGELFDESSTQRIVTATVEVPFTTNPTTFSGNRSNASGPWYRTKNLAKQLFRKWAYIADVEDLPIVSNDEDGGGTFSFSNPERTTYAGSVTPSVVMYPVTT